MIIVLLLVFVSGFAGPPPSARVIGVAGLGLWLFVPWGYWIDRHRELRILPDRSAASQAQFHPVPGDGVDATR